MTISRTAALSDAGVSIWLDDLSRDLIESGGLAALVNDSNVVGVTTNPTILAGAIGSGAGYRDAIADCAARGLDAEATVFELSCADVARACDALAGVYASSGGRDGRVSIEVSPALAHDAAATVAQARELWARVDRPNAMIKIPATEAGLLAIAEVLGHGISVNATLIFGVPRYREVVNSYLTGLEIARGNGIDLSGIHSVASVFVSRFDALIDPQLDALGGDEAAALRGRCGLANARLVHEAFVEGFSSVRARMLLGLGANPQRPLWASTGTKDPRLSDTLYVSDLAIPGTVNTMPAATLAAFADHGEITAEDVALEYRDSDQVLNNLDGLGIDYAASVARLETEGLQKFEQSWSELLASVAGAQGATG